MPRNGLAFAIIVRGQYNFGGFLNSLVQFAYVLFFALTFNKCRCKIIMNINRLYASQFSYMAKTGHAFIFFVLVGVIVIQKEFYFFTLGR